MKKILLIISVALMVGCKTENIYLVILPAKSGTEITETKYVIPDNRFRKKFHIADSLFTKASDEAMKSATLKIKREYEH